MLSYYPPVGFHFRVEFGGLSTTISETRFQEVTGLASELGVEEVVEGGENRFPHRLPTRGKYSNLVLKRGLFTDSDLVKWCSDAIQDFVFEPATINVTLLNEESQPLADTYSFVGAWPLKWSVTDFKASDNSVVVETLEFAYNYFTKIKL